LSDHLNGGAGEEDQPLLNLELIELAIDVGHSAWRGDLDAAERGMPLADFEDEHGNLPGERPEDFAATTYNGS
jgi:hypothetical protein